jgi:hypothetical protein
MTAAGRKNRDNDAEKKNGDMTFGHGRRSHFECCAENITLPRAENRLIVSMQKLNRRPHRSRLPVW